MTNPPKATPASQLALHPADPIALSFGWYLIANGKIEYGPISPSDIEAFLRRLPEMDSATPASPPASVQGGGKGREWAISTAYWQKKVDELKQERDAAHAPLADEQTYKQAYSDLRDKWDELGAKAEAVYGDPMHRWQFGEALADLVADAPKWKQENARYKAALLNIIHVTSPAAKIIARAALNQQEQT